MMQWFEGEDCKPVLHDSSTVDCSQAGQDTSRTDLMLQEASAMPVLDFGGSLPRAVATLTTQSYGLPVGE
jgi:hypothetical protein